MGACVLLRDVRMRWRSPSPSPPSPTCCCALVLFRPPLSFSTPSSLFPLAQTETRWRDPLGSWSCFSTPRLPVLRLSAPPSACASPPPAFAAVPPRGGRQVVDVVTYWYKGLVESPAC